MTTNITVRVGTKSRSCNSGEHHHDDDKELPGWATERKPKDEPHVSSKSLALGQWLKRASEHSGPQYAPGVGIKKSSQ